MRFLFTTIPGFGHFQPMVPLAQALEKAGHTVAVVAARSFARAIEQAGLIALSGGLDWDESRLLQTLPEINGEVEQYQGEWLMQQIFSKRSPRTMFRDLLDIIPKWQPDVIVSGTYELAGPLAAEKLAIPYASCSISFRWNQWALKHSIGRPLRRLRRDFGLPPDPHFLAFGRYLDLCMVPKSWSLVATLLRPGLSTLVWRKILMSDLPINQRLIGLKAQALRQFLKLDRSLKGDRNTAGHTTYFIRPATDADTDPIILPDWVSDLPHQRTIYATLGTVFGDQYLQIFSAILAGLSDETVNLVLTVGPNVDPAAFGPQPANIRIYQYIPPTEITAFLSCVDLCISHAGYGTTLAALSQGIPLVVLPLSADQPILAQMCFLAGVAPDLPAAVWRLSAKGLPVVRPERLTPALVRTLAMHSLDSGNLREAARKVQHEIRAAGSPTYAVSLLEKLGACSVNHAA